MKRNLQLAKAYAKEFYWWLFDCRPKGKVTRVGAITGDEAGGEITLGGGWAFDAAGCNSLIDISVTGKVYFCGYTVEELKAMAERERGEGYDKRGIY